MKAQFKDSHAVVYEGKEYKGGDFVGRLCRELKTGTLEIYRGDMLCLTVNVEERAKVSLTDSDTRGLGMAEYRPFYITRGSNVGGENEIR